MHFLTNKCEFGALRRCYRNRAHSRSGAALSRLGQRMGTWFVRRKHGRLGDCRATGALPLNINFFRLSLLITLLLLTQVFYPDEFNGAFAACPDPIAFTSYTSLNVYSEVLFLNESSSFFTLSCTSSSHKFCNDVVSNCYSRTHTFMMPHSNAPRDRGIETNTVARHSLVTDTRTAKPRPRFKSKTSESW